MASFKEYFVLIKPGIVRANALTAAAGFFVGSAGSIYWSQFALMLSGITLVVASGCVINNYIDRGLDRKMARTKRRATATGSISTRAVISFGTVLGVAGLALLAFTTWQAAAAALGGWVFYVVVYSFWKRRSPLGTVVGSISGAAPPVVGYAAATGRLDAGALILFLILVFWQMPHFYSIAIFRLKDYAAAGLPVLPAVRGVRATQRQALAYIAAFIPVSASLAIFGYTGRVYLVVATVMGIAWLALGIRKFRTKTTTVWALSMFKFSLLVLLVLCVAMSLDATKIAVSYQVSFAPFAQ